MFYTKEDTMPYKELECDQGETLHVMDVDGYILPAFERVRAQSNNVGTGNLYIVAVKQNARLCKT